MGQAPDEIREGIATTRERMADTAGALAHKADIPGRAREWASDKTGALRGKTDAVRGRASDATPSAQDVAQKARRGKAVAEGNPIGLAIAGAAVGFIAGLVVPATRIEDERIGPKADELKGRATEVAQEAVERGKQVAQEAGQSAVETVRERGREEGQGLASSAQEHTQEMRSTQ